MRIPPDLREEYVKRAFRAFWRYCESHGFLYDQPSNGSGFTRDGIIELYNARGTLAQYKVLPSGRIKRISP